ncbi:MAG TPA: cytochrome c [Azospira sp.]|nr:cytochrome c [Azospira sp.]
MKKILAGTLVVLALGTASAALVVHSGHIDVAADATHSETLQRLLVWAREQSIARRSAEVVVPDDLASAERIRRGAGNYAAMCVSCHLAPGIADAELRKGLNPLPPDLARGRAATAGDPRAAARQFRIIKHGVAATGMPAWAKVGMQDSEVWDLVAFLQVLPTLDAEQYRQRVAASDGHSHAGAEQHAAHLDQAAARRETKPAGKRVAPAPAHDHAGHAH